jgi:mono/diheme cytochrome c family protein
MSEYVDWTLASISTRRPYLVTIAGVLRLVVVPALLFALMSGATFALAELHLAKPGTPKATYTGPLGDPHRGAAIFQSKCASCHGTAGRGGGVGPRLAGSGVSSAAAKAQIDAGGGVMPAGLVAGRDESDVLAYLATITR